MTNIDTILKEAMTIEGAIGAALVDFGSGMALGTIGGGNELDIDVAAAGNTDVVRAKVRAMELLNIQDDLEDILVTLGNQYHIITLPKGRVRDKGVFFYLALSKKHSNLALARHKLHTIQQGLVL